MASSIEVLKLVSNKANQRILSLLKTEASFPRRIAKQLVLSEAEVSRRLRRMEKVGLVEGAWNYEDRTVKRYALSAEGVTVRFRDGAFQVEVLRGDRADSEAVPLLSYGPPNWVDLVGRKDLVSAAKEAGQFVVLQGIAGIGKSVVAATHAQAFKGRVFWHTLRSHDTFGHVVAKLAAFAGIEAARLIPPAAHREADDPFFDPVSLRALDRPDVLLVWDDYSDELEPRLLQLVEELARSLKQAHLLATSREMPRFVARQPATHVLPVGPFTEAQTLRFLQQRGIEASRADAHHIHEKTGGHPQTLLLLSELVKTAKITLAQCYDDIPEKEVEEYVWEQLYKKLPAAEQHLLGVASVFQRAIPTEALARVSGDKHVATNVVRLEKRLLLTRDGEGYRLPRLLRDFCYAKLPDRKTIHQQVAAYYAEQGTLTGHLEALDHYLRAGRKDRAIRLLDRNLELHEFDLVQRGHVSLYDAILHQFTDKDVSPPTWASILDERGDCAYTLQDLARAREAYEAALQVFAKLANPARSAEVAWKLALVARRRSKPREALQWAKQGIAFAQKGAVGEGIRRGLEEFLPGAFAGLATTPT